MLSSRLQTIPKSMLQCAIHAAFITSFNTSIVVENCVLITRATEAFVDLIHWNGMLYLDLGQTFDAELRSGGSCGLVWWAFVV